ncbi:MAG: helix-turn-helix domain-containing protein [Solirubrobacterales bacterium]
MTTEPSEDTTPTQTRAPSPRRADAVRNEQTIADTAMRVLADHPSATMNEIAAACGLGRATLYRHFANRDALVRAIQQRAAAAGARALAVADLDEGDPIRALRRAIRALVGVGYRYRLLGREPALDPGVLQRQPALSEQLVALILRGQSEGALRDDLPPEWILPALASLLVLALRELEGERLTLEEAAERVASTLLDGLIRRDDRPVDAGRR